MHWYTCKSLLNTLGKAVEQLVRYHAKQAKVSSRGQYKVIQCQCTKQRRLDMLTDLHETARNSVSHMVSKHCKINVEMALEVCFCTHPVTRTRTCRSTILSLRIVEMEP